MFAKSFAAARSQLLWQRRGENGLRENTTPHAVTAARQGIAAYPESTIARSCLLWALRQSGAPASEVLAVAQDALAATAYRAVNRRFEIRTLAHAAQMFPGDVRIFSLYAQSNQLESDSVLPSGLARFPASADLLAVKIHRWSRNSHWARATRSIERPVVQS